MHFQTASQTMSWQRRVSSKFAASKTPALVEPTIVCAAPGLGRCMPPSLVGLHVWNRQARWTVRSSRPRCMAATSATRLQLLLRSQLADVLSQAYIHTRPPSAERVRQPVSEPDCVAEHSFARAAQCSAKIEASGKAKSMASESTPKSSVSHFVPMGQALVPVPSLISMPGPCHANQEQVDSAHPVVSAGGSRQAPTEGVTAQPVVSAGGGKQAPTQVETAQPYVSADDSMQAPTFREQEVSKTMSSGRRIPCTGTECNSGKFVQQSARLTAVQPTGVQLKTSGAARQVRVRSPPLPAADTGPRLGPGAPRDRARSRGPPRMDGIQASKMPPYSDLPATMSSEDVGGSMQFAMASSFHAPSDAPYFQAPNRLGGMPGPQTKGGSAQPPKSSSDGVSSFSASGSAATTRCTLRSNNAQALRLGHAPFLQVL